MRVGSCIWIVFAMMLSGCLGPIALTEALPSYDEAMSQLERQSLLLNVARRRHKMPTHFSLTTSIAATFSFTTDQTLGASIPVSGSGDSVLSVSVGTGLEENPTIQIIPLQGDDFAKRILTPLDDEKFGLLLAQQLPFDMVMRLMARAFRYQAPDGTFESSVRNRPDLPEEYDHFRRIALHLEVLAATNQLFIHDLAYTRSATILPAGQPGFVRINVLEAAQAGFELHATGGVNDPYELSSRVVGNLAITNYDPLTLSDSERHALNKLASLTPSSYVQVDIRPDSPGGEFPIFGSIQLRSLHTILRFVADGISEVPEYAVAPDERTTLLPDYGGIARREEWNPAQTLEVVESEEKPASPTLSVPYRGSYYSVANDPWDLDAFGAMYLLFQVSTEVSPDRAFPITISK